jgi:hypothetical protein
VLATESKVRGGVLLSRRLGLGLGLGLDTVPPLPMLLTHHCDGIHSADCSRAEVVHEAPSGLGDSIPHKGWTGWDWDGYGARRVE